MIVDNGSHSEAARACLRGLERDERVSVARFAGPLPPARLRNLAAAGGRGPLLAFLDADLEPMSQSWLEAMVQHALRPEVGAVGAKLYSGGGHEGGQIQHAGMVLGIGGIAGCAHRGLPRRAPGEFGRAQVIQQVSAVSGACMLVRRDAFESLSGFDETFATRYYDVDYCLRAQAKGYCIIFTPDAELGHPESAASGWGKGAARAPHFKSDSESDLDSSMGSGSESALQGERRAMIERWGSRLLADPFYNPNLTLVYEDFSLGFPPRADKPWREG